MYSRRDTNNMRSLINATPGTRGRLQMGHQQHEAAYKCEVAGVCHSEAMVPTINTKKRTVGGQTFILDSSARVRACAVRSSTLTRCWDATHKSWIPIICAISETG